MTNESTTKRTPDHIAYAIRTQAEDAGPKFTRIGVGFHLKNGGVSILYDAIPVTGQIVLLEFGVEDKPSEISYGTPQCKPNFEASMVKNGTGDKNYWTQIGSAWRKDGYISVKLDVVPVDGKIILTVPRERE